MNLALPVALIGLVVLAVAGFFLTLPDTVKFLAPVIAMGLAGYSYDWRLIAPAQILICGGLIAGVMSGHLAPVLAVFIGCLCFLITIAGLAYARRKRNAFVLDQKTDAEILSALLDAVPVVLLDKDGGIKHASTACQSLFGFSLGELSGKPFAELVLGFDPARHLSHTEPHSMLKADVGDWQAYRKDLPPMPVDLSLEHSSKGSLIRLIDLTPRHAADAQARELHSQLNKVWRLNSLGEMAATLAHELNQPLGAAASYIHAAQEDMKLAGPLGESAFRTSELAKNQMLRAGQIIRRMRELLTMEMRALAKERVSRVVDDVLPILMLTGKENNVSIRTDIAVPDTVRMDRIQVQQALVNLVRNAVEACPQDGQVLITGQILSDRSYEIAVEDNGSGIAPDKIESVFQPMTTTKSGGMGLGLSVTRTIVESHGGHLSVGVSRWGGARFSFTLTVATQEDEE